MTHIYSEVRIRLKQITVEALSHGSFLFQATLEPLCDSARVKHNPSGTLLVTQLTASRLPRNTSKIFPTHCSDRSFEREATGIRDVLINCRSPPKKQRILKEIRLNFSLDRCLVKFEMSPVTQGIEIHSSRKFQSPSSSVSALEWVLKFPNEIMYRTQMKQISSALSDLQKTSDFNPIFVTRCNIC